MSATSQWYDQVIWEPLPRSKVAREVHDYLYTATAGTKHVISLVGSSVADTIRLMEDLRLPLALNQHLVVWLDVSVLIQSNGQLLADPVREWINSVKDEATVFCPGIAGLTFVGGVDRWVEQLAEYLCDDCQLSSRWPVVFVKGFDEFADSCLAEMEYMILYRLLSRGCVRIIMGRRHDQTFSSIPLRNSQRTFEVEKALSARRQRSRLHHALSELRPIQASELKAMLKASLPSYKLNHPVINGLLFGKILAKSDENSIYVLTAQDLAECCKELISASKPRPDQLNRYSPPDPEEAFSVLRRIAEKQHSRKLKACWTDVELRSELGLSVNEVPVKSLFDAGLIVSCGEEPSNANMRYRMTDGLSQLVGDLYKVESAQ